MEVISRRTFVKLGASAAALSFGGLVSACTSDGTQQAATGSAAAPPGAGVKQVVVCPIAFVSDHVETLYEIRMLFAEEAKAAGITHYVAADGLNDHPAFVDALADVCRKALLAPGAR